MPVKVQYDIIHVPQFCTAHKAKSQFDTPKSFSVSGRITTFADIEDFRNHLNWWGSGSPKCFVYVVRKVELIGDENAPA